MVKTNKSNKVNISVNLDIELINAIHQKRGLIPFSTFINDKLNQMMRRGAL